jgi:RNA polymerase sigma-70 factor (ECF subfamily)
MKVRIATIAILTALLIPGAMFSARGYQAAGKSAGKNIVINASIEKGSGSSPEEWQMGQEVPGVEYIWHSAAGYKSKRSLCLKKTEDRFFPIAQWFQSVPYTGDAKRLTVSTYVRARTARKAILDVQFLGSSGQMLGHKWAIFIGQAKSGDPPANHDWKRYSGTVDIPAGTKEIVIAPQMYGPGVVWFDEISAVYAP